MFVGPGDLRPDYAEAFNNVALVYLEKGAYKKALKGFREALQLMPGNAEVCFNIALVYLKGFKDKENALYYLKRSLQLDPHHSRAELAKVDITRLTSASFSEQQWGRLQKLSPPR